MSQVITLIEHLQRKLVQVAIHPPRNPSRNTTKLVYGHTDIQILRTWRDFNVQTILQQYRQRENVLHAHISEIIRPRIRRSLRIAFAFLANHGQINGRTEMSFDAGETALTINNFTPDTAYFDIWAAPATAPNRAPGDIKPSWKQKSKLEADKPFRNGPTSTESRRTISNTTPLTSSGLFDKAGVLDRIK
ncbi:hypothetical protein DTO271D3_1425 [Paecilomyces variotii]|nr:hypothetical protein DTO271D3_1425 [Paecilomyces variotii]